MENKEPKIFFTNNLKFLRERKKVSQAVLSEAINVTRVKLALIEIGKTKAMEPHFMLSISNYFKISLDTLMTVDISKLGELKIRDLEAGNDIYIKGGNLRVLAISVDKSDQEHVDYVPIKGRAGYVSGGYADPDYISELPKYHIPNLSKHRTYRTFPVVGDSMLPFPQNMDITGKFIEDWSQIKPESLALVVLKGQDIIFKAITLLRDGVLQCRSLNPIYELYTVPLEEILEIWEFHSYHTTELPETTATIATVLQSLDDIKKMIIQKP
ncbi:MULTISPECIES: helix-turn-helix domain-containing protein [Sphingobacterium]|jgi:transcriptional regulator with XRE-family HTH domain|uniref:XRE family transcriptional regulator n=2 Tax=Sphingobacteriaceae TaxID=84566 RepID=UPI0010429C3B|nr:MULTISPECIES: helix-turn-helix domain-containing protein [unclassified Sphingobacterium]MCS3557588.1 transcriptional regulator with XRE-family HTH domain [Sphingobacterium sp. JUb21]TCQ95477.1 helix-turn-helix protein [Sphingobacterium sp. JUb20]